MKKIGLVVAVIFYSYASCAQKKPVSFADIACWPLLENKSIKLSNDGKYVVYSINAPATGDSLTVQATGRPWKRTYAGIGENYFTEDSKRFVYLTANDKLGILNLATGSQYFIDSVSRITLPKKGNGKWLAYLRTQPDKELIVMDLIAGNKQSFKHVTDFQFNDAGSLLWMKQEKTTSGGTSQGLLCLNTETEKVSRISQGYKYKSMTFAPDGSVLVFFSEDVWGNALRYYKAGMDSSQQITPISIPGMIVSAGPILFNKTRDKAFFRVQKTVPASNTIPVLKAKVTIQSYRDRLRDFTHDGEFGPFWVSASLKPNSPGIVRLQRANDYGWIFDNYLQHDYLISYRKNGEQIASGSPLSFSDKMDLWLVDAQNASRILIRKKAPLLGLTVSTTGKYIIWFDKDQGQWYNYNVANGLVKNITARTKRPFGIIITTPANGFGPFGLVGWMNNDASVILLDKNDLWQIDPEGKKLPINLTHNYGQKHSITLSYLDFNKTRMEIYSGEKLQSFRSGDTIMLSGFNQKTKENGFFKLILHGTGKLEPLVMEPRLYDHDYNGPSTGAQTVFYPVKAKSANKYIVERMSATEYPNLYVSDNLEDFQPLTNLAPQKQYNWYSSELYHWTLPGGKQAEGVLYRPEDFDLHRKYPIIFFYYEKYADGLHSFIHPALSDGEMNIPWFVSHGYLVFIPDIQYTVGYPGLSAYNYVISAALSLEKEPFVDTKHMALQGHSFGGFETNYIVSHSSIFAAAASSSGLSELISQYGTGPLYYEQGQFRMGATIWKRPNLYLKNSPLLCGDKVTTPLLIMANPKDASVPYLQGREWFGALDRLGKKVWLLSYPDEGHMIDNEKNQLDYSIRLAQFFDHYLKGMPAPLWMTGNISEDRITSEEGFKLDTTLDRRK